MRSTVYYEIKKLCSQLYLIMFAIALLLANAIFCGVSAKTNSRTSKYAKQAIAVYSLYKSDPELFYKEKERIENNFYSTYDEVKESVYGEGIIEDISLFRYVASFIDADKNYHNRLNQIITQSSNIIKQAEGSGGAVNTYNYRYQEQVIKIYSALDESVSIDDTIVIGWNEYFEVGTEIIFVFAAVLICSVWIAVNDYHTGFYAIEKTCANGRENTAAAKYLAAMIAGAVLTVAFNLSSLLATWATLGFSDPSVPVQSVSAFLLCPYNMSILGYLIVSLIIKMLTIAVFSSVVLAISSVARKFTAGIIGGAALLFGGFLMSSADFTKSGQVKYINFWSIFNLKEIFSRYRSLDIIAHPVSIIPVSILPGAVLLVAAFFVNRFGFARVSNSARKRRASARKNEKARSLKEVRKKATLYDTSLLSFEQRKRIWIIFLLAAVVIIKCAYAASYFEIDDTSYNRIYTGYIAEIEGEYSSEKAAYLRNEYDNCNAIVEKYGENTEAYFSKKMSIDDYLAYCADYSAAQMKIRVLGDIMKQSGYLGSLYNKGVTGSFVNELYCYKYLDTGTDWILVAFLCVLSISGFSMERRKTSSSSSPSFLLGTTLKGRTDTFMAKYLFTLIYAVSATVLLKAIDLVCFAVKLNMPPTGVLLVSMTRYAFVPTSLSLGQYIGSVLVFSLLGAVLAASACFAISYFIKDNLSAYVTSAIFMFAPGLLQAAGVKFFCYIDISKLTDADSLYRLSAETTPSAVYAWFAIAYAIVFIFVGCSFTFSLRRIHKGGRL